MTNNKQPCQCWRCEAAAQLQLSPEPVTTNNKVTDEEDAKIDFQALRGQRLEGRFYLAECLECGEIMPSNKLIVSRNFPDGDADCYCPHCNTNDCDIADLGSGDEPGVNAWNFQQKRIEALLDALAAKDAELQEYRNARIVPAGWVAVPAEPTGDMLARIKLSAIWTTEALTARYKDMLRAAPRAPYAPAELQECRNAADPKNHFLAGYDVGHSRGLTCGQLYKGDDQVRSHRIAAAATYMEQLENDQ